MTRILYFGHMRSSFARVDALLLNDLYSVKVIDMARIVWKYTQLPNYFLKYFTTIVPGLIRSDIVWMWTADYMLLPVFLTAKLFSVKTVVNIEGYEVHNDPEVGYGIQGSKIRGWIARWTIKHADCVIVQCSDYVIKVTKLVPEANVYCMPGALENDYLPSEKRNMVMTAYCTYKNSYKVKGIRTFERAMNMSHDYEWRIVRDMPHREMINRMKEAKVYCQLSFTESFGQTLLEAMACGCVPVVTERGGMPELVGDTGVFVPFGDAIATLAAVDIAMTMDGNKARERSKEFSTERKIQNLQGIVRKVLK